MKVTNLTTNKLKILRILRIPLIFYALFYVPTLLGQELKGLGDVSWNTEFSQAREKFKNLSAAESEAEKTEILNIVKNEFIMVRRNDIIYRYSFYKTPYATAILTNPDLKKDEYETQEAKLFHVQIQTPLVDTGLVEKKLIEKYGPFDKSTGKQKGSGAGVWLLDGGMIYLWYESYNGRRFTRRIDYTSSELLASIQKEYKDYFDAKEKLLLQKAKL